MNQNLLSRKEFIPSDPCPFRGSNPSFFERSSASLHRSQPLRTRTENQWFFFTEKCAGANIFSADFPKFRQKYFLQKESLPSLFSRQQVDIHTKEENNSRPLGILKAKKCSTAGLGNSPEKRGIAHQKIFYFNRKFVFFFLNVCTFESHYQSGNEAKVDV